MRELPDSAKTSHSLDSRSLFEFGNTIAKYSRQQEIRYSCQLFYRLAEHSSFIGLLVDHSLADLDFVADAVSDLILLLEEQDIAFRTIKTALGQGKFVLDRQFDFPHLEIDISEVTLPFQPSIGGNSNVQIGAISIEGTRTITDFCRAQKIS